MDKENLRIYAKNTRKTLNFDLISSKIIKKITQNSSFIHSKHIMVFYPLKYEPNLLSLLDMDKQFYLPRVKGDNIEVCPYSASDKLIKSEFGVMEPLTESVNPQILDLVIIPALMADENGYRLGFGKGFYDRFLADNGFYTICVVPKELYVKALPYEVHDQKVDEVITDV